MTFYEADMPEAVRVEIRRTAATSNARISESQDSPVFSTPPLTEREAPESPSNVTQRETGESAADTPSPEYGHNNRENPEYGHSGGEKNPWAVGAREPEFDEAGQPRRHVTLDDVDDSLRLWNASLASKATAARYLEAHGAEADAAQWLAREYHGADSGESEPEKLPMRFTFADASDEISLTWEEVKERVRKLIRAGEFFTRDELEIINPDRLTAEDAETLAAKIISDSSSQYSDATTPGGRRYAVGGDGGTELIVSGGIMRASFQITAITNDSVLYTLSDMPEAQNIRMERRHFEAMLDQDLLSVSVPAVTPIFQQEQSPEKPLAQTEEIRAPEQGGDGTQGNHVFAYGDYHFEPVGSLPPEQDFKDTTSKSRLEPEMGMSKYEWGKYPYSHAAFYEASGYVTADIFRCVENGKFYLPGANALFEYTGEFLPYPKQEHEALLSPEQREAILEESPAAAVKAEAAPQTPQAEARTVAPKKAKAATPKKRAGRSRPEVNYRTFVNLFPEIVSGQYEYLRMKAGEGYMPMPFS